MASVTARSPDEPAAEDWRAHVDELTDGVVRLTPMNDDDDVELAAVVRDSFESLERWMAWATPDHSPDDVCPFLAAVARGDERAFAVRRHGDDRRLLGMCGLHHVSDSNRTAALGYWLARDATGTGLATRAGRLVLLWAVDHLGLRRIEVVIAVGNEASRAVARRLGLATEGLRRDALDLRGGQHDAHVHVALVDDVDRLRRTDPARLSRPSGRP